MMKRSALAATSVAAVLAVPVPLALAAEGLAGTYKETIAHDHALGGQLDGTWRIALSSGRYAVSDDGHAVVHGRYTVTGDQVTFSAGSGSGKCPAPGVYRFKRTPTTITFTIVKDSNAACAGRRAVLAHGPWKKVG